MNLWIQGMRRSGTTILYDALREDSGVRGFYEPLREEAETEGGGSGARRGDAFAETRALRHSFRDERFPELPIEEFNWGGPRAPELELEPELPEHCLEWLRHLLAQGPRVAIKETRLHHKLAAVAELDPDAVLVHVVRDPRAVSASMLLGRRRRRLDLYPDADAFFTLRTDRKLWSSRAISDRLARSGDAPGLPPEPPDFMRPLAVWKGAFDATHADGRRLFGDRYLLLRLEDMRVEPASALERIYERLDWPWPGEVGAWAEDNVRPGSPIHLAEDPRWAEAMGVLGMEAAVDAAGYAASLGA